MAKTIKFKLYDTALHTYYKPDDVYITGDGRIYVNNSSHPDWKAWEPLNESGEGCELRDIEIIEETPME